MTIRISEELKAKAEFQAKLAKRSIGKQIELWAEVGEAVCSQLSAEEVYALLYGNKRVVTVDASTGNEPSMDAILSRVEDRRASGTMREAVLSAQMLVESDPERIGGIRVVSNGNVIQGDWINGRFVPLAQHQNSQPAYAKDGGGNQQTTEHTSRHTAKKKSVKGT